MLNASGGKVTGQVEKLVETKANTTLVLAAICGVGSQLHMCFVTSHCLNWAEVFSFCHWSSQLVLCFWPLPRFKQGTIFAAQQTWTIWAVPMVASTFIPGSESMRQWGLKPVWPNDFQKWSLRSLWRGCFVQRFYGPKSLLSVTTMLALMQRVTYCAVTVACHTQDLLPKTHFRLHDPKGWVISFVIVSASELVHFFFSAVFILHSPCILNWTCPKSQVKLDASFAEAFLVATAEDTSTVLPLNSDEPKFDVKNTIHGTVQLTKLVRIRVV